MCELAQQCKREPTHHVLLVNTGHASRACGRCLGRALQANKVVTSSKIAAPSSGRARREGAR